MGLRAVPQFTCPFRHRASGIFLRKMPLDTGGFGVQQLWTRCKPYKIGTQVELAVRPGAEARLIFSLIQGTEVPCSLRCALPSTQIGEQLQTTHEDALIVPCDADHKWWALQAWWVLQAAEKPRMQDETPKNIPHGLKPVPLFSALCGTPEVVPFQKMGHTRVFPQPI